MKKFLLSLFALMLSVTATLAAHWTAPTTGYQNETPVYVQLVINGTKDRGASVVELAAFIDGECRGISTSGSRNGVNYIRTLNVKGNNEDMGKTIVFRAYYGEKEYTFTKTATFSGESVTFPFTLELLTSECIISYSLPANYLINIGEEVDLLNDLMITYSDDSKQTYTKKVADIGSYPAINWVSGDASTVSLTGSVAKGEKSSSYNGIEVGAWIPSCTADRAVTIIRVAPLAATLVSAEFSDDLVVEKGATLNLLDYLVLNFATGIDDAGNVITSATNYNALSAAEKAKIVLSTKYSDEYFTVNTDTWVLTGTKSTPYGDPINFDIFVEYDGTQFVDAQGEVSVTPYEYIITDVTIENPIVVEKGETVNLIDKLTFTVVVGYDETSGAQVTAQKSASEIALPELTWNISEEYAAVEGNVLTALKSTDINGVNLDITVSQGWRDPVFGNATVMITPYAYEVTEITIESPLTLTVDPDTDKEHPTSMNLLDKVTFTVITGFNGSGAIEEQMKASQFAAPEIIWTIDNSYALIENNVITARKRTSSTGIELEGKINGGPAFITGTATVIITPDFVAINNLTTDVESPITVYRNYDDNEMLEVVVSPADAAFDPDVITFTIDEFSVGGDLVPSVTLEYANSSHLNESDGTRSYLYTIVPNALNNVPDAANVTWYYEDPETGDSYENSFMVKIGQAYTLTEGWNWTSLFFGGVSSPLALSESVVDMRSDIEVGYNDPTYGWIGTLNSLTNAAYKIKVDGTETVTLDPAVRTISDSQSLTTGWNWIYNPYQFDYDLTDFVTDKMGLVSEAGDKIVTLTDGSLEYDGSKWVGTLSTIEAGHFFMLKRAATGTIKWGGETIPADLSGAKPAARRNEAWDYDAHAYSDVMTLIGTVEGKDVISVGAFVNGECRGEGSIVENDGQRYFFVNVHGKVNETVTFEAFTGEEYIPLQTVVSFTSDLGTLLQPVALGVASGTTGIQAIDTEANDAELYDLSGRRCSDSHAGGIYVIRRNGVASKVIK